MDRDAELRLECLRIARQEGLLGSELISRAGELCAFCNGETPAMSSAEIKTAVNETSGITDLMRGTDTEDAAWDAVEARVKKPYPDGPGRPIAKAVGKDGNFDKPFSDYLKPDLGRD